MVITTNLLLMLIIAILLPPLAVFLKVGLTFHFWVNLILTLIGYLPGILHAIWIVLFF
ncbi:YqaE/Pmp3 family membrane protein [Candidatus Daviesbacteria bacterium]|nr:YqaE/Pmp3 family membrane protein [Candidatus Daviesbacteria bacterium]